MTKRRIKSRDGATGFRFATSRIRKAGGALRRT
jgi:hypothetical protein